MKKGLNPFGQLFNTGCAIQDCQLVFYANYFTKLLSIALFVLLSTSAIGQVTISIDYKEKNNLTTIQSGGVYTLQLSYSVSSTTGNASGVQAVINLPDNIRELTSYVGTIHAPTTNFVFTSTPGAKKLTITFVDPVASGSTGVLEFGVVTNNFTTLNNTVLATAAEMTATGGYTSGVQNQTITVTAIPRICAQKVLLGGGALDNETRYRITVSNTNSSTEALGTLQSTNITLTDNLPTGTEFVSAKIYNISGAFVDNGTESGGVVTIPIPDLNLWQYSPNFWQANYYFVIFFFVGSFLTIPIYIFYF